MVTDEKVFSYVSGELKRASSTMVMSEGSDSAIDVRSQHRQLQIMQTVLDGGRRELANYHEVMTGSQNYKDYTFAENAKKMWAKDLVENKALSIVESGFGGGVSRQVVKDAMDHNGRVLVEAFQQSTGLKKGYFATQILKELEAQKENNAYILSNHLRQAGIYPNNMDLQLYALLEEASVAPEEKEELSRLVGTYVQKNTQGIDLWKGYLERAKANMADVSQGYTSALLSLKDQFETMSPHKRLRYDGENLVKFVLNTAKDTGISVKDQLKAQDHSTIDILKGKSYTVFNPIREKVLKEVSRVNDEKHWNLTDEQKNIFTTSLLNVAVEKQILDVELYQSKETTRNYELKDALAEASYNLIESSLGAALEEREEKWAQNMVTVHANKKHAKDIIAAFRNGTVLEKAHVATQINEELAEKWSPQQGILKTELNNSKLYGAGIERSMYGVLSEKLSEIDKCDGHKDLPLVQSYENAYRAFSQEWAETRQQAVLLLGEEAKSSYENAQSQLDKVYEGFIRENVKQNSQGTPDLELPHEEKETRISFRESVARAKEIAEDLEKGAPEVSVSSDKTESSASKTTLDSYNISALVGFTNRKADDIEASEEKPRVDIYESIYLDVRKKVSDLNQKKSLGLRGKQLGVITKHILDLSQKYHDYDLEVKASVKDYWEQNPGVEEAFWECLNAKKAAAIELVKSPVGLLLQDENGKWSQDLKKAYKTVVIGQKVEEYKELLNDAGSNKELKAKLYEDLKDLVYGKDGESFNKKAYQVICKENKIYFKRDGKDVRDHGQALGPQHPIIQPQGEPVVNAVEVGEKPTSSRGKPQPQRNAIINSERDKAKNNRGLSDVEFDKFIDDVKKSLRLEELAKDLLRSHGHNEKSSNSTRIAFTDKGSLVVNLTGEREGSWYDFRSQKGGSMFDLIQQEKGLDFKGALSYLSPYCRGSVSQEIDAFLRGEKGREVSPAEGQAQQEEQRAYERQREIDRQKAIDQKIADVHDLLEKTEPLESTPAETYLRNERGIKGELPLSLRYIPAGTEFAYNNEEKKVYGGALASIAKDSEGCVKAVQVTYLTEEGTRALNKEGQKQTKISYGIIKGAFVDLTPPSEKGIKEGPLVLAEGVESALSVKESGIKGEVYCSLGTSNINNLDVKDRNVIIAGDWDGSKDKPSWKMTEEAKKSLEEKGNKVCIIHPVEQEKLSEELTPEKVDFNDLLKTKGVESIVARLSEQVSVEMAPQLSHRENQKETSHEQTKDVPSNEKTAHSLEPKSSTTLSQDKEKSLEKVGKEAVSGEIAGSTTIPKKQSIEEIWQEQFRIMEEKSASKDKSEKIIENTVEVQDPDANLSREEAKPRKKTSIEEVWENQFKLMEEKAPPKEKKELTLNEILKSQGYDMSSSIQKDETSTPSKSTKEKSKEIERDTGIEF